MPQSKGNIDFSLLQGENKHIWVLDYEIHSYVEENLRSYLSMTVLSLLHFKVPVLVMPDNRTLSIFVQFNEHEIKQLAEKYIWGMSLLVPIISSTTGQ